MEILDPAAIEPFRGTINYWALQTIAMMLTAAVIPRMRITSIFGALGIVLALALANATIWDTALFFSVPQSFSRHALTLLAANGIFFWVLVKLLPGIEVDGFAPAFVAPVVFTAVSLAISAYGRDVDVLELGRKGAEMIGVLRDQLNTDTLPPPA